MVVKEGTEDRIASLERELAELRKKRPEPEGYIEELRKEIRELRAELASREPIISKPKKEQESSDDTDMDDDDDDDDSDDW